LVLADDVVYNSCILVDICCFIAAVAIIFFVLGMAGVSVSLGHLIYLLLVIGVVFFVFWIAARFCGCLERCVEGDPKPQTVVIANP
jgi:hypothetical protein